MLSVLGVPISRESSVDEQRKAYHGLARLLHPDRLGRHFPGATKAFQFLTSAFESLTAPEPSPRAKGGKGKAGPTVGRSNDGCYRTKVTCPRCGDRWGVAASGLQPYEYTFLMQGLRTYVCCTCLLRFGCMSAGHHCPHCDAEFAYHPKKYHEFVRCMRCKGEPFGFRCASRALDRTPLRAWRLDWRRRDVPLVRRLYTTGPRIEAALRAELLEKAGKRQQRSDADAGRQQRRPIELPNDDQRMAQKEVLFRVGLADACPRCGFEPTSGAEGMEGEGERARHLRGCTDKAKHRSYAAAQGAIDEKRKRDARNENKQEEVGRLAAWRFLGGGAETAWMLTDKQLQAECVSKGVEAAGSRVETLARLAASGSGDGAATDGGGEASGSIPSHLHSLSADALRSVCAAHGLSVGVGKTKEEIIELLENRKCGLEAIEGRGEAEGEGEAAEEESGNEDDENDDDDSGNEDDEKDDDVDGV